MVKHKPIRKILTIFTAILITITNIAFSTNTATAQTDTVPQLISPSGLMDTNHPLFSWVASSDPAVEAYEMLIFRPGGETSQNQYPSDQLQKDGDTILLDTGEIFEPGDYSWTVRSRIGGDVFSDYSQPLTFTIPSGVENTDPIVEETQNIDAQPTEEPLIPTDGEIPQSELSAADQVSSAQLLAAPDGNTFYVAPNGNDNNSGSESAPWASLRSSINRLSAGQTLYVRGGTYSETLTVSVSGESGNPINIIAYPGETPVIDGNNYQLPSSDWAAMLKVAGNFIHLSGFEVRSSNWMAVVIFGSNNVISGFNVHHNKENGILITGNNNTVENSSVWMNSLSNENASASRGGWSSGLSAARHPNNTLIRNNVVYMNWGEGLSTYEADGTVIEGNIVYNNYSANIYISDATNILLQRNFVYGTADSPMTKGARVGIMMGDEKYNPASSNIRVLNNIVFGTYKNFYWWQGTQGGGMNNVLIANNTFVNSRADDNFRINVAAHQDVRIMNNVVVQEDARPIANINGTGLILTNNLWSKTPGSAWLDANSLVAEALLVKAGSETETGWFDLNPSSPAINHGVNLAEISEDFDLEPRDANPDIGADEFLGQPTVSEPTIVPTSVPTGVPTSVPTTVPTALPTTVSTAVPTTVSTVIVNPTSIPVTPTPTLQPNPTQTSTSVGIGGPEPMLDSSLGSVNLAKGKAAKQSSKYSSLAGVGVASLAVDGNTNGNFSRNSTTHTKKEFQAWWQVDLGSVQSISTINVWNRTDCCSSRLEKFYVLVSDAPFGATSLNSARNQAGVSSYYVSGRGGRPTTIDVNRTGRYVRVQLTGTNFLSLAEVQVWNGHDANVITTPVTPIPMPTGTQTVPTSQPTPAPTQPGIVTGAYYVATNGSDSNTGTQNSPWRTIQYAVNRLSAGKTLYVRGGVYRETLFITKSGASGNRIKILAYPGETPIIDGNNYQMPTTEWGVLVKITGSYLQITGFEVRYSNWMAVAITGSNTTVSGFNVHHNKENGILITGDNDIVENSSVWMNALSNLNGSRSRGGWSSGLSAARSPNNAIIRNNKVYQNWGEGLSTFEANGTLIEGNIVYDNYSANIYISDATNILLQRNFVYATADSTVNKGSRTGIMMGDEKYTPASSNIRIINNIVFGTYRNFYWWQGSQGGAMNNVLIANNTFVNSRSTTNFQINNAAHQNVRIFNNIITQDDSLPIALIYGSGISLSNNLWSKSPGSTALGSSSMVSDPTFAKIGNKTAVDWYKLLSGSSAINKGRAVSDVTIDYTGYTRSNTLDIGAYEYR